MMDLEYKAKIRKAVAPKFKGKRLLCCRTGVSFPHRVEREYIRLMESYVKIIKEAVIQHLPEIAELVKARANARNDSWEVPSPSPLMDLFREVQRDLSNGVPDTKLWGKFEALSGMGGETLRMDATGPGISQVQAIFHAIEHDVDKRGYDFQLHTMLHYLAALTNKLSVQSWKLIVGKTLGINILEDYYLGKDYGHLIPMWVEENVNRIVRIPKDTLGNMMEITQRDVLDGKTIREITKDIQAQYDITRRHAKLIARDQTGKLYGQIAKHQQQDAGVQKYIWSGVLDNRERDEHIDREGQMFDWDDPPEDGHPGEPIQCRCVALPVFDFENLDIVGSPENGEEE